MAEERLELVVTAVIDDAEGVRLYELKPRAGGDLPPFAPGAHIAVHLANGLIRHYSIASSAADRSRYLIGVARDRASRGGSALIHDTIAVGTSVFAEPPKNNFPLADGPGNSVLIAGGIGITPIMSMIDRLVAHGRPWRLHYATRTRAAAPFLSRLPDMPDAIATHFDEEAGGALLDIGAIVGAAAPGSHFYCCGPTGMIDAFRQATRHLPPDRVHLEYFAGPAEVAATGGFEVVLARSGKTVTVAPGETILETVRAAGVAVPFSCLAGVCGSCETRVISGIPDHHDLILTDREQAANKTMMICCSGAKSDTLVLDL